MLGANILYLFCLGLLPCHCKVFEKKLTDNIHRKGNYKFQYTVIQQDTNVDLDVNKISSLVSVLDTIRQMIMEMEKPILNRRCRSAIVSSSVIPLKKNQNYNSSLPGNVTLSDTLSTSTIVPLQTKSTYYFGSTNIMTKSITSESGTTIFSTKLPIKMNKNDQRINWTVSPTKKLTLSNTFVTLPIQSNSRKYLAHKPNETKNVISTYETLSSTTLPFTTDDSDWFIESGYDYVINTTADKKSSVSPEKSK